MFRNLRLRVLINHLKSALQSIFLNRIWIDSVSSDHQISEFISLLKPVSIDTPIIRIGPEYDGGYLIPDDLEKIEWMISPGVSDEVGFDSEIMAMGVNTLLCDGSVSRPKMLPRNAIFVRKHLDVYNSDTTISLDSLASEILEKNYETANDFLLQMDIEGNEYKVLLEVSDVFLSRCRIMVIEFHDLSAIFGRFPCRIIKATLVRLLKTHHIVHIHPNNTGRLINRRNISIPDTLEITFLRKDRTPELVKYSESIDHDLDSPNDPTKPEIIWQPPRKFKK